MRPVVVLFSLVMVACVAVPEENGDEGVDTSEGELRALTSPEIVGDITPNGPASEVTFEQTGTKTQYRAFRFRTAAGAKLTASVVAANGSDTVAYLLGDTFKTLKTNDDRATGAKDSEIVYTVRNEGTYYVAFRSKDRASTKFTVTLKDTSAPEPPAPWYSGWPTAGSIDILVKSSASYTRLDLDKCEPVAWSAANAGPKTEVFTVNASERTIAFKSTDRDRAAPVRLLEDGTFTLTRIVRTSPRSSSVFSARGHLEADKVIVVDEYYYLACSSWVDVGRPQHSYTFEGFKDARGTPL